MPDNLDIPVELPVNTRYFGKTTSSIVLAFATYGAVSMVDDARRHAKRLRVNWKARQALKAEPTTPTE